tara:strand:- start:370 stop:591 length:222 start_codon:yes stop_codon:yes gene_type:complete
MTTQEQIDLIQEQIKTNRESLIDLLMFVFDTEEIPSKTHLKLIESLKTYETQQRKYLSALETEQIKFDLFEKH